MPLLFGRVREIRVNAGGVVEACGGGVGWLWASKKLMLARNCKVVYNDFNWR